MPQRSATRKRRVNRAVVKKTLVSLDAIDADNLSVIHHTVKENGREATNSRVFSVALKLLRHRLENPRESDVALWLFR